MIKLRHQLDRVCFSALCLSDTGFNRWTLRLYATFLAFGLLMLTIQPAMAQSSTNEVASDEQAIGRERGAATSPRVATGITPEVRFVHQDRAGNIIAMTDEAGAVAWRAEIDPFGQGSVVEGDQPLHFLEQPLENEIGDEGGLYMLGARFYDPVSGRFLSIDPEPLELISTSSPQEFNRYGYAVNNPLRYADPSGLAPSSIRPPGLPPTSISVWASRVTAIEQNIGKLGGASQVGWRLVRRQGFDATVHFLQKAETVRNGQRVLFLRDVNSLLATSRVVRTMNSNRLRESTQIAQRPPRAPGSGSSGGPPGSPPSGPTGKLSKLKKVGKRFAKILGLVSIAYGTIELADGNYAHAAQQFADAIPGVGDAVAAAEEMGFGTSEEIFTTTTTFWGDAIHDWVNE